MKLKVNTEYKELKISDSIDPIKVSQYLPIQDKYDMVTMVLQNSKEGAIYNSVKIELFFNLYLVYLYTDISFTEKQKEDPEKIYDVLKSNGILTEIIKLIPDDEYNELLELIDTTAEDLMEYDTRAGAGIRYLVDRLPEQAESFGQILNTFDPEKFMNVVKFAIAANGGQNIAV